MNDNEGALADIIIAQLVTILLLALILWRIWQLVLPLALEGSSTLACYPNAAASWGFFFMFFFMPKFTAAIRNGQVGAG